MWLGRRNGVRGDCGDGLWSVLYIVLLLVAVVVWLGRRIGDCGGLVVLVRSVGYRIICGVGGGREWSRHSHALHLVSKEGKGWIGWGDRMGVGLVWLQGVGRGRRRRQR